MKSRLRFSRSHACYRRANPPASLKRIQPAAVASLIPRYRRANPPASLKRRGVPADAGDSPRRYRRANPPASLKLFRCYNVISESKMLPAGESAGLIETFRHFFLDISVLLELPAGESAGLIETHRSRTGPSVGTCRYRRANPPASLGPNGGVFHRGRSETPRRPQRVVNA